MYMSKRVGFTIVLFNGLDQNDFWKWKSLFVDIFKPMDKVFIKHINCIKLLSKMVLQNIIINDSLWFSRKQNVLFTQIWSDTDRNKTYSDKNHS